MSAERGPAFGDMDPEPFARKRIGSRTGSPITSPIPADIRSSAQVKPGAVRDALPTHAPEEPEDFAQIFADFERVVMPAITHWNHPGFFAYFAISGSGPACSRSSCPPR